MVDSCGGCSFVRRCHSDLRDGDAFLSHPEYQEPHVDIYRAMLQRPIGEDGFLRFGRFVPFELPGIGFVDGLQGQVHQGEHARIGAVGGLKPNRIDLDGSVDEPLVVPYAAYETGPRDGRHYSGTVGLLNSYYDGDIDRLALLIDQRAGLARGFTLYSTAAVDFDIGASETKTGTRLTQLNVSAVSELSSFLTLRAGVDHWERPDHEAERDLLPFQDERFFDDGYWRYWIGSSQNLPGRLWFSEEVGYIDSDTVDGDVRWQVGVTRSGLGDWQDASVTVAACLRCHNDLGPVTAYVARGCGGCHGDPHASALGSNCGSCHGQANWKPARSAARDVQTRFHLIPAHAVPPCATCHVEAGISRPQVGPTQCGPCHQDGAAQPVERP